MSKISRINYKHIYDVNGEIHVQLSLFDSDDNCGSSTIKMISDLEKNEEVIKKIVGLSVACQNEFDDNLHNLVADFGMLPSIASASSLAAAKLRCEINRTTLYRDLYDESITAMPSFLSQLAITGSNRYKNNFNIEQRYPRYSFVIDGFNTTNDGASCIWSLYRGWSKKISKKYHLMCEYGDNMFFPPSFAKDDLELFSLMSEVINEAEFSANAGIGIDVSAASYYDENSKKYEGLFSKDKYDDNELIAYYNDLTANYPIAYLSDPLNSFEKASSIIQDDSKIILATSNPGDLWKEDKNISVIIDLLHDTTITEQKKKILEFKANKNKIFCNGTSLENSDFIDMSVAFGLDLAIGCGPGEYANRYHAIEENFLNSF